jgi:hypothetical protein
MKPSIFLIIPGSIILLLMAMYFSGSTFLQQIIAPTVDGISPNSWREFGLLEQLQNILLAATIGVLFLAATKEKYPLDRIFYYGGSAVFLFLLLEEIDYGIHFYEFIIGDTSGIEVRNWHNQKTDGKQNVKRFKQVVDILIILQFIVLPLMRNRISNQLLRTLIPSRWFILGFVLIVACSKFAHLLDDRGMGIISGVEGNLSGNISEFRELGNYYFFLIYAFQLYQSGSLFGKNREPELDQAI